MKEISTAWLTTNYTCNCNCDWCYATTMLGKNRHIDFEYSKRIVNHLKARGVKTITLIGGEPTIYPNIIELINYIKHQGLIVRIASNGKRFSDSSFTTKIVNSQIDGVNISIKGITEDEYMRNTHQYGLLDMINGYNNLRRLGANVSVSFLINSNDITKFDSFIKFILENKMNNLVIQYEKPSLRTINEYEIMDIKKMGEFTRYIYIELEKSGINYTIETSFPICLIEEDILLSMIKNKKISTCCHLQKETGIVFDVNGTVIPCNHFLGYPYTEELMNLDDIQAIDKLLDSKIVEKLKETVKRYPSEKCISCEYWKICGGGCFTRWFYINPNEYIC